jgi:hypothetical protein
MRYVKWIFPNLSLMLLVTLMLSLGAQAYARHEYNEVNWDSLNLSNQQRSNLNSLDAQWHNTVTEVAPRIQGNEKKLKLLMNSSKADESQIIRLQEQIHEDKTRLKVQATQIFLDKRKCLNREQQDKLRKMINLH